MAEYKPYYDPLFNDADKLMWALSEENGCFTNQVFIRRTAQKYQPAYVRFLCFMLNERGEDSEKYVFNLVHQSIGSELSARAQALGYEQRKNSGVKDVNIWGDLQEAVVYCRTDKVKNPNV